MQRGTLRFMRCVSLCIKKTGEKKMSAEDEIQGLLEQGEILKAEQAISALPEKNAGLVVLEELIKVFHAEALSETDYTVFDYSVNIGQLTKHFIYTKLLMRRLEFDLPERYQEELYSYCRQNKVSQYFLASILLNNIFKRQKVCKKLIRMFEGAEGKQSRMGKYFRQTLVYLEEGYE